MFHLAIVTPGRDTGLAVGVAVDEPFLRLKTSVVSVMPELGLVLAIKSKTAMSATVDCERELAR